MIIRVFNIIYIHIIFEYKLGCSWNVPYMFYGCVQYPCGLNGTSPSIHTHTVYYIQIHHIYVKRSTAAANSYEFNE